MKAKTKIGKIFKGIAYAAYIAVFVLAAISIALSIGSKMTGKVAFVGDRALIWVLTESMEPEIPEKSYIIIRRTPTDEISVGDVITYQSDDPTLGGAMNTHRVVEIKEGEFITKGDNNPINDRYPARADKVVGVYERNLPVLSWLGKLLTTPNGIFGVVIFLVILTFCTYLPDLLKIGREKDEQHAKEGNSK